MAAERIHYRQAENRADRKRVSNKESRHDRRDR